MDRQYKKVDRVLVFETVLKSQTMQKPVDTFSDRPYSHAGTDTYLYKGSLYPGYLPARAGDAAIFLDAPLSIPGQA